jgi:hypothetical protein
MRSNPKISKNSADLSTAMNNYTALITVKNEGKNHWITLRFHPKEKILEVFDSLQLKKFSSSKEKYKKVGPPHPSMGLTCIYFISHE